MILPLPVGAGNPDAEKAPLKPRFAMSCMAIVIVAALGCVPTQNAAVRHSSKVAIYLDRSPIVGQAYTSLGVIHIRRSKVGYAWGPWGWDWLTLDAEGLRMSNPSVAREVSDFLEATLVAEAMRLGANAILEVSYSAAEYPTNAWIIFFLPTRRVFYARGEAIVLGR